MLQMFSLMEQTLSSCWCISVRFSEDVLSAHWLAELRSLSRSFAYCVFLSLSLSLSFQLKDHEKAATAAHTYFQANPEHVEMGRNLEQYKSLQGVDPKHFIDREARPHQVFTHKDSSASKLNAQRISPAVPFDRHLILNLVPLLPHVQ